MKLSVVRLIPIRKSFVAGTEFGIEWNFSDNGPRGQLVRGGGGGSIQKERRGEVGNKEREMIGENKRGSVQLSVRINYRHRSYTRTPPRKLFVPPLIHLSPPLLLYFPLPPCFDNR